MKKVSLLFFLLSFCLNMNSQTPVFDFAIHYQTDVTQLNENVNSIYWRDNTVVVNAGIQAQSTIDLAGNLLDTEIDGWTGVTIFYSNSGEVLDYNYISNGSNRFSLRTNDNVDYTIGGFQGTVDFDFSVDENLIVPFVQNSNNFVSKNLPSGSLDVIAHGDFSVQDACFTDDFICVVGSYINNCSIAGPIENTFIIENGEDLSNEGIIFIFDYDLNLLNFLEFASFGNNINFGCDYSPLLGEISVSGRSTGTFDYEWLGAGTNVVDHYQEVPFLVSYNENLELSSLLTIENSTDVNTYNCQFTENKYNEDGEIYVSGGLLQGTYLLDLNGYQTTIIVDNPNELILLKLSSTKELQWIRTLATEGTSMVTGLQIDHNGFINACGTFHTNLEFEGTSTALNGASEAGFIARWTPEGELVWANTICDGGFNSVNDICITPQNEMFIGGWFTTYSTDFDFSDEGSFDLGVTNSEDAFLAKYTISNPTPDVFVEQGSQTTEVTEAGATDAVYVRLSHAPSSPVQVIATPNAQLDLGNGQGVPVTLNFAADATAVQQQLLTVTAFDDVTIENLHSGLITFTINSSDSEFNGLTENAINVVINDNDVIGVEELNETSFSISPNPASNELNISFATIQQNVSINIFDESGKLVLNQQVSGQQHRINISELAFGNYTVAIQVGNEKYTKTFIKH